MAVLNVVKKKTKKEEEEEAVKLLEAKDDLRRVLRYWRLR